MLVSTTVSYSRFISWFPSADLPRTMCHDPCEVSYMKELYDKTYILSGERLGRIMVQSVQDQGATASHKPCT